MIIMLSNKKCCILEDISLIQCQGNAQCCSAALHVTVSSQNNNVEHIISAHVPTKLMVHLEAPKDPN